VMAALADMAFLRKDDFARAGRLWVGAARWHELEPPLGHRIEQRYLFDVEC